MGLKTSNRFSTVVTSGDRNGVSKGLSLWSRHRHVRPRAPSWEAWLPSSGECAGRHLGCRAALLEVMAPGGQHPGTEGGRV